ncbi:MAG: L-seryl-tRNA(Sec) selenium transferase [Firmicutes bacterium]|jgi:L-seryl-tRNA(Ser) seleniumtransferase|nr:L-seryl-tRNA(Sec) selenium transferase [Bacillota bacterium]
MNSKLLRKLPKVDELLMEERVKEISANLIREQVVDVIRAVVETKRKTILESEELLSESFVSYDTVVEEVIEAVNYSNVKSLRRVINGTGVVLHTNLGRAKLAKSAMEAVAEVADKYSTLEYDPVKGRRGSRHDHVEKIIEKITGAEAAMVVNNNAAATTICLATLGRGKEIIISRGELVEIGGSFRIPEIMEESGAHLVEVGTTNKTKLKDYQNKINEQTGALMKVHTSNYKVIGFTEEATLKELVNLGKEADIPVIYDMGNGLMVSLRDYGIDEPTVKEAMSDGADVILFSGDKLLGGPQGGVIIGKKKYIDMMKAHPLARILRVDKMTLAAMEATFKEYYDDDNAKEKIPTLKMLTRSSKQLEDAAGDLLALIKEKAPEFSVSIEQTEDVVGGGSAPATILKGYSVSVFSEKLSAQELEKSLRTDAFPIIVRINRDKVLFDVRTLTCDEYQIIAERLGKIIREK